MGWGVHDYPSPPEPDDAYCPVCNQICETLYRNWEGEIVGCDQCIDRVDAYEWQAEHNAEQAEFYKEMMRDV